MRCQAGVVGMKDGVGVGVGVGVGQGYKDIRMKNIVSSFKDK